jgi:WD40 repeat protein/predicted 2-oxoglutarate/Fe(II)-dependent dioxygenase YbiX
LDHILVVQPTLDATAVRNPLECFLLRGVLGPAECRQAIREAERAGFSATDRDYPPSYRDNDRLVLDDPARAAALFGRLRAALPAVLDRAGARWRLQGLNARFRFCRYQSGQQFGLHRDGPYAPSPDVRSWLTCMLYLNDAVEFQGGGTRYYAERGPGAAPLGEVRPEAGAAIVFDHALWHDGEPVTSGTKYVMRTDVMYRRDSPPVAPGGPGGPGHAGYVWCVVARRGGGMATGGRDCRVRSWERHGEAWEEASVQRGHDASVTALAEDRDGNLWSGSRDRRVVRWEGARPVEIGRHEGAVLCLSATSASAVASGGADHVVRVWDARGNRSLTGHRGWIWALATLPDGRLVSGSEDGTLRAWTPGGTCLEEVELGVPVRAIAVNGSRLYVGHLDGTLARWDVSEGLVRRTSASAHQGAVCSLAVRGTGEVVSGGEDDRVHVLDALDLTARASYRHADFVRSVAVLADGSIASASYDGKVAVWEGPGRALE